MAKTIGSFDLASLKKLRDDVTQYFWFESNSSSAWGSGAHVTLYPESQFTDSTSPNYMKGQNIIMNTDGFSIRDGGLPMMVLDNDSLAFNVVDISEGTYTTTATFTATGAQIGRDESGYTMLKIDPTDSSGTGITEVFYIKASNDTTVQKVILDENYTREGTVDKSFSGVYVGNGIGSYSSPLTTTVSSATPVTYTISEIDDITDGEPFTLQLRLVVQNYTSSTEWSESNKTELHTFTKASTGVAQTSSNTWTSTTPIDQMFFGYLQYTSTLTYDPTTSQVTIELSARVTQSSSNRTIIVRSLGSSILGSRKTEIYGLSYMESGVMIPINQVNGDLYACASQDVNGDYQPLGRLYVGVDTELGDVDLYDALDALGWAVPPIIV